MHNSWCAMKEICGTAWLRLEIRKLSGASAGGSIRGDAFDAGKEKAKHICGWTVKNAKLEIGGPEQQVAKRNEALACKKLLTCDKRTELRNLSTRLCSMKCRWENQMRKVELRSEWEQE